MARNGIKTGGGSRKGKPNKDTALRRADVRAMARGFIEDPAYLAALKARLEAGTAGSMESLLWTYGFGRAGADSAGDGTTPISITIHF